MDGAHFDSLARSLTTLGSRRRLLGGVLAGVLGLLGQDTTEAKKGGGRKKRVKKKKPATTTTLAPAPPGGPAPNTTTTTGSPPLPGAPATTTTTTTTTTRPSTVCTPEKPDDWPDLPHNLCGGVCVFLRNDDNHCGTCGNSCNGGDCVDGTCNGTCPPERPDDCGICVNLQTDPKNCGSCFSLCEAGKACVNGVCG